MKKQKSNDFKVYFFLSCIFFIPLILFIVGVWLFLPQKIATTVIGFVGFVIIVAGPFWAMQLEKRLRDFFSPRKKKDDSAVINLFEESE